MTTATDNNIQRTGSFGPPMQLYGLVLPRFISNNTIAVVQQIFGRTSVISTAQYPHVLVKLPTHNAKCVLEAKLPELIAALYRVSLPGRDDRIGVIDMSDWTVREFVLDTPPSNPT